MKSKDIIFLVVAIVAWLYSSYRTYQKQIANKKSIDKLPIPDEPKPVPQQITKRQIPDKPVILPRTIRNYENAGRKATAVSLEKMVSDIPAVVEFKGNRKDSEKKPVVHNIQPIETNPAFNDHSIDEIIEEIHSGKIDWRKAVILNEIIRPVYFK